MTTTHTRNRNANVVHRFTLEDGTVTFEHGRDSLGGYAAAVGRVEVRTGQRVDRYATAAMGPDDGWTVVDGAA